MLYACFIMNHSSDTQLHASFRQSNYKETKLTAGEHVSKDYIIFFRGGGRGLGCFFFTHTYNLVA